MADHELSDQELGDLQRRVGGLHNELARERKAARIALYLNTMDARASIMASLDREGRYAAASLVGVTAPSLATWDRVVELLKLNELVQAKVAKATGTRR